MLRTEERHDVLVQTLHRALSDTVSLERSEEEQEKRRSLMKSANYAFSFSQVK